MVEFEEDRRIAWKHFGAHRWRYELEELPAAEGGGTRVTETWDATRYNAVWTAAMKAAGFPERNRRGIEATLVRLKDAAEADARAAPASAPVARPGEITAWAVILTVLYRTLRRNREVHRLGGESHRRLSAPRRGPRAPGARAARPGTSRARCRTPRW